MSFGKVNNNNDHADATAHMPETPAEQTIIDRKETRLWTHSCHSIRRQILTQHTHMQPLYDT